ncbi:HlyD family secretion protein [Pseudoduganella sp. GCM10020061]|uniref:HlyD family secretion protein n=1 Tax=Pseudoduganella sp. GCM10020061 TaxID=3317345 RepID=UPI003637FFA3
MKAPFACLAPLLSALALAGCRGPPPDFFPGYAEADYVRLSSPIGGVLARSHVERGALVAAGAPLFVLEQDNERAARLEAEARVARARAVLANLEKGSRAEELAVLDAQLAQAESALRLSEADLARQSALVARRFISAAQLDQARSAAARDRERVREMRARRKVARLGARSDELAAARQEVQAALAQLRQSEWRLAQKSVASPLAARVADVLYREGEMVEPGAPVVSLLAPQYMRARFFVPQSALGSLRIGQRVRLRCDGCPREVPAAITYIAAEAEYTAPLIYSQENRSTLVFMVEGRPLSAADAALLHPGQPLEVRVADGAR